MHATAAQIDLKRSISEAVESAELTLFEAWADLDALSTHTLLEQMEVDEAGIIFADDDSFRGTVNFYVLLQYGRDLEEGFVESDSYSGSFEGRLTDGGVVIDSIRADTSSFYE